MNLFYRCYGSGRPVVILHGLFGLSDNWVTFGRQLASSYTVYIPDLRNHGQSPHSQIFDLPSMENDIMEMLDQLGLEEVYLMGHSMGGKVAMFCALHHPETIRKLVVVDISLRKSPPGNEHQQLLNAMLSVDFSTTHSRSDVSRMLAPLVKSEKLRQFLLKNVYWRDRKTLDWRLNLRVINEMLPLIFEAIDETGMYPGPSLFIRGGLSDYILESDLPAIKMKFPGARVETIAETSHWVHADAPGEFFGLVRSFLDDISSG